MGNVTPPAFYSGYTVEFPSLLIANILRDIGFLGASVILWSYFFCGMIIRFGEVKIQQKVHEHKSIYIGIGLMTVFFIGYDMIGVNVGDSGVSVNAIFNGVSGFSLFLYILLYFVSHITISVHYQREGCL